MTSELLKELKKDPNYQKNLEKLSDEERKLTEQALESMFQQFEQNILGPLKNLKFK